MKVLFLNPRMEADSEIVLGLQQKGISFLFPEDSTEAFQLVKIHGFSLDLAIVHREGRDPSNQRMGLDFIERVKADQELSDLPIILTTESWGDSECAQHQSGPHGANAYLRAPFSVEVFQSTIETILGQPLSASAAPPPPPLARGPSPSSSAVPPPMAKPSGPDPVEITAGLVLEDASQVFLINEDPSGIKEKEGTFVLEMPELPPEPEAEAPDLDLMAASAPTPEPPRPHEEIPTLPTPPAHQPPPSLEAEQEPSELISSELPETDISRSDLKIPGPPEEEVRAPLLPVEPVDPAPFHFNPPPPAAMRASKKQEVSAPIRTDRPRVEQAFEERGPVSADNETLRSYLLLREQDVAVLTAQVRSLRDQNRTLELGVAEEQAKSAELSHLAREQAKKLDEFNKRGSSTIAQLQIEIDDLKVEIRTKNEKIREQERQLADLRDQGENLKERVRVDIRKIRVREKELESRIEIMKKDAEAVLNSRELKIIELKKKLDLVEFNFDLLQEQYAKEKDQSSQLRERLGRAAQVVKVAGGLLDAKATNEAMSGKEIEGSDGHKEEDLQRRAS